MWIFEVKLTGCSISCETTHHILPQILRWFKLQILWPVFDDHGLDFYGGCRRYFLSFRTVFHETVETSSCIIAILIIRTYALYQNRFLLFALLSMGVVGCFS
jgi:hypothetical protein